MSDTPTGWMNTTLGEVCQPAQYGWTASATYEPHEFKLLRTTDLRSGTIDWNAVPFSSLTPGQPDRYLIRHGDLLISRAGSVGVSTLIEYPPDRIVFASYLIRMRPLSPELAPILRYFLMSPAYWDQVRGHVSGIAIPNINASKLSQIRLSLPPLQEQRRIVDEVEKQFTRLASVEALLKNIVQRTGTLLKEVARPCSLNVEEPKVLSDLPDGWRWRTARELCHFITKGTTPASHSLQKEGDIPYIKVYNLTFSGKLNFAENPTFIPFGVHEKELTRSEVRPNDVLMNIVGPPLGKVSMVPPTYQLWNINQAIARFRAGPDILPAFLTIVLQSTFTLRWLLSMTKATVGQVNLTLETCRNIPIPTPPLEEQKQIVDKVAAITSLLEANKAVTERAQTGIANLRRSILAKAFSGQLAPQDPFDEPVSMLLDRIREQSGKAGHSRTQSPRRREATVESK